VGPALDPIFQAAEPEERVSRGTALLWQYFFFPVLMVAAAVGVFVLFGAWSDSPPDEKELLETVMTGSENAQKQAAQQLAIAIAQARSKADRQAAAGAPVEMPFFADAAFSEKLRRAYLDARRDGKSEERQRWLAQALGRAADPLHVPLLVGTLYPTGSDQAPASSEVRRAAALGLLFMESRATEAALVRALTDREDGEVRAIAANGLALLGARDGGAGDQAQTRPALAQALQDAHPGVTLNAAVALALRGDAQGLDLIARSLTRSGLGELGVRDLDLQRNALVNAIRAVVRLSLPPGGTGDLAAKIDALKPALKALAEGDPDESVRAMAREGLERWRKTP
jgi:hypothetical protein